MRTFRSPHLAAAHEWAVRTVLEKGYLVTTENGEETVECEPIALELRDPLAEPMVSSASRFQRRFLEQYAADLLEGTDAQFEYDYHSRLFAWGEGLAAGGLPVRVDQVAYIVGKLQSSPVSRRAVAVTWNPVTDEEMQDCPCLQLVSCQLRDGRVSMQVVFRSNDMLSAAGANMFALVHLQRTIAERLGAAVGTYTHISLVPHLYHRRDAADLARFCEQFGHVSPVNGACEACRGCPGR
ncbi:MAG TPA: thymidylate synthase [Methanoregulaceae archaeon]|nr:thymidylate synthase [Methanoregulaceae archaeon]